VSVGAIQAAAAQQPDAVSVDVSECVKLSSPEERLACFEAQVEAAGGAPAPASSAPAAGTAPAAAGGATAAAGAASDRDDENDRDAPPDILAKVTALRETVPNAYLITLSNDQVWRQTVPESYPLRVGSDVRIYYSRWRAYRHTDPQLKGFIQVERVR
jgi:hypothetical protein